MIVTPIFFHFSAMIRKKTNSIKGLLEHNGDLVTDPIQLKDMIKE